MIEMVLRMRILKIASVLILVLSGCVVSPPTLPQMETDVIFFHGEQHIERGTIAVLPVDSTQENSLEFASVSQYLRGKLGLVGYRNSESTDVSDYVAYITYGIDNGRTSIVSIPMMGQTGGGTTYSSGTVTSGTQMGSFSGTSTTMPTYGIVGGMPMQITQFKREVNIDIYKRNQDRRWNKVYEIKAASVGSCGNINSVIRPIIDAIFWNFHEQSGVTYRSRPYLYNPC